jgi:uncharacterized protein (DUF3820 family)
MRTEKIKQLDYKFRGFSINLVTGIDPNYYANIDLNNEECLIIRKEPLDKWTKIPLLINKVGYGAHKCETEMYNACKIFGFDASEFNPSYPLSVFWNHLILYLKDNRLTDEELDFINPFFPNIKNYHFHYQRLEEEKIKHELQQEEYRKQQEKYKPLDVFYKMPFGKYKGKLVSDVCKQEPQYILYLINGGTKFTKAVQELATINKKIEDKKKYRRKY